jgi:uncharacterized protein (TIGR02996 family)
VEIEYELLAAIARDPEDPAPYLVYADYLQTAGSLRGELMTLQNATEDRPGDHRISDAALDHVRAHAAYYLGSLSMLVDHPEFLQLGWRCGFIASALLTWNRSSIANTVSLPAAEVLSSLLALDAARFLTRLVVEPTHQLDATFVGIALEQAPASLRELWLGPRDPHSGLRACNLGTLRIRLPHLRELRVHGEFTLLELDVPSLRSATVIQNGPWSITDALVGARWPNLEKLHVWGAPPDLAAVFARDDLVVLGDLGLINCERADALCSSLARSPLAPQLFRLSLSRGTLTDAGVEVLVANRASFPSLGTIDVSETFVSPAGLSRLRLLAPEVVGRDLRTGRPRVLIPPLVPDPDDD